MFDDKGTGRWIGVHLRRLGMTPWSRTIVWEQSSCLCWIEFRAGQNIARGILGKGRIWAKKVPGTQVKDALIEYASHGCGPAKRPGCPALLS